MRSLAVFRIALGSWIVVDHVFRARFLEFDYTGAGYLPRVLLGSPSPIFSLHLASDGAGWQMALFAAGIVLGALLALGYRTRIVTPLCWVVVGSLLARNEFLLDAGDVLIRTLLLWSIFLPLGACWSLDARRRPASVPPDGLVLSPASVALLLQFLFLYFHAGVLKNGPEWRAEGTAVAMVLGQTYWKGLLSEFLLGFEGLLALATPIVVWFETLGPFLLFSPVWTGPVRVATIAAFLAFQASLGLGIELNLFPFASSIAVLPFLPSWLWERVPRARRAVPPAEPASPTALRRWSSRAAHGVAAALLAVACVQFFETLGVVSASAVTDRVKQTTGMIQRWRMYSPGPPPWDPSFAVVGRFADGETGDVLARDGDATWRKIQRHHRTYRFKGYWEKTAVTPGQALRTRAYLSWICRHWNASAPPEQRLEEVQLVWTRRMLAGPYVGQSESSLVGEPYRCERRRGGSGR